MPETGDPVDGAVANLAASSNEEGFR